MMSLVRHNNLMRWCDWCEIHTLMWQSDCCELRTLYGNLIGLQPTYRSTRKQSYLYSWKKKIIFFRWNNNNSLNSFKQMKIITVYTQLKQLRNKAWKKFRPERESNPWPLRYRCSALTNWAIKPTGSWSIVSSLYTRGWRRRDKNTWKSYICTAENTF